MKKKEKLPHKFLKTGLTSEVCPGEHSPVSRSGQGIFYFLVMCYGPTTIRPFAPLM